MRADAHGVLQASTRRVHSQGSSMMFFLIFHNHWRRSSPDTARALRLLPVRLTFRHLRLLFVIVVLFHLDLIYHQKYYHQTRETHPRSHPGDAVKEKSCALPADRRRCRRLHPRARRDTHLRERAHLLARRRGECTRAPLRPAALLPRRRHRAALRDRPAAGSALRRGLSRSALRGDRGAR